MQAENFENKKQYVYDSNHLNTIFLTKEGLKFME